MNQLSSIFRAYTTSSYEQTSPFDTSSRLFVTEYEQITLHHRSTIIIRPALRILPSTSPYHPSPMPVPTSYTATYTFRHISILVTHAQPAPTVFAITTTHSPIHPSPHSTPLYQHHLTSYPPVHHSAHITIIHIMTFIHLHSSSHAIDSRDSCPWYDSTSSSPDLDFGYRSLGRHWYSSWTCRTSYTSHITHHPIPIRLHPVPCLGSMPLLQE